MNDAVNLLMELISDQFRFGEERLFIFKMFSKILMMSESETIRYGYSDEKAESYGCQ